tara:strand:- start:8517 stop:8831 length:315 start_codon:yes stop_codon:yes gene_type:complete
MSIVPDKVFQSVQNLIQNFDDHNINIDDDKMILTKFFFNSDNIDQYGLAKSKDFFYLQSKNYVGIGAITFDCKRYFVEKDIECDIIYNIGDYDTFQLMVQSRSE